METIRIPLGKSGHVDAWAVIDFDDYEKVIPWKWYFKDGYAFSALGAKTYKRTTYMHSLIMDRDDAVNDGLKVDHIDRDPLNNRKSNLRIVTTGQNNRNSSRSDAALRRKIGPQVVRLYEAGVDLSVIVQAFAITERQAQMLCSLIEPKPALSGWNTTTIIQAIQCFYAKNARVPKCADFNGTDEMPPTTYIYRYFDGIEDARVQAGLRR